MSRLLVTQARGVDRYGSPIDYLEDSFVHFFSTINVDLIPVSNCIKNIRGFVNAINFDGLVISGGSDVNPKYLKSSLIKSDRYSKKRDSIENDLIDLCLEKKKLVLGVCYGMQKLNTYFGGEISSDSKREMRKKNYSMRNHSILIKKSLFGLKGEYLVNQFHNYTIEEDDLAMDLEVVAVDISSGNIEAFVHKRRPVLGIQWHPDRASPDIEFNKELISMFIMNTCINDSS